MAYRGYLTLQRKTEYFSDWVNAVSGVVKGGNKEAKTDFAIKITAFVEAGNSTGYLADVKREHDGKTRYLKCVPLSGMLVLSFYYLV